MKTTYKNLRSMIREALSEQVVGYKAPSKGGPEDDYLGVGDTSVPTASGSQEEKEALDTDVRTLTKQRQDDLDKGDTVDAAQVGNQLSMTTRKLSELRFRILSRLLDA